MTGNIQLLVFCLDERLYALHLSQVRRVIHSVDATPLPHAPDVVMGLIDLQGEIVPLMNVRGKFRIGNKEIGINDQFIIANTTQRAVALAVDQVKGVIERPAKDIIAAQKIVRGLDQIEGVIQLDDGPALIHDLDRFLSLEEEDALEQALTMDSFMKTMVPEIDLQQIRQFIADTTGLDFPAPRWLDLRRGISAAAKEFGFDTCAEYIARLMAGSATRKELESLVNHLTVGETYFFREKKSFEILADRILPALIRARRDSGRSLRIWSAACCTGEEPYSIAILLSRIIPDWEDWNITLLATDINSRFLRKAAAGQFGKWSFRDAPPWLLCNGYFRSTGDGHFEIVPHIKRIVRFERLNLADNEYPSAKNNTNAIDVIFCRNVLMYFTPTQARNVVQRLCRAQADDGWLVVGPGELTNMTDTSYVAAEGHGAAFYQKKRRATEIVSFPPDMTKFATVTALPSPPISDQLPKFQLVDVPSPPGLSQSALLFANQGNLSEALAHCDRWIASDKFNPASHYLRGAIMQEKGETDEAIRSLRTVLYLDPKSVRAHFALGNIARGRREWSAATRHLINARNLVRRFHSEDPLAEFEGVTAARFLQIVDSLIESKAAA